MKKIEKASLVLSLIVGIAALFGFILFVIEICGHATLYNLDTIVQIVSNYVKDLFSGKIYGANIMFVAWAGVAIALFIALLIVSIVKHRKAGIWHSVEILLAGGLTIWSVALIEKIIAGIEVNKTIVWGKDFTLLGVIYVALAVVAMLVAIALFVVDCVAKGGKQVCEAATEVKEPVAIKEAEPVEEPVVAAPAPAPVVVKKAAPAKKPAVKKAPEKKDEPKKETVKKAAPAKKAPAKKPAAKKPATKKAAPAKKAGPVNSNKEYSISRHLKMNKWQFKEVGSSKAIRLFATRDAALEYAKKYIKENGGIVVAHGM